LNFVRQKASFVFEITQASRSVYTLEQDAKTNHAAATEKKDQHDGVQLEALLQNLFRGLQQVGLDLE